MRIYAAHTTWVKTIREDKLLTMLESGRRERVEKLKNLQEKERSICAGLLLRHSFLEAGYSENEWETVKVEQEKFGKPRFVNYPKFHYSLSHSGEWVVCVVDSAPIGIDIQRVESWKPEIAKRFYNITEYERLEQLQDMQRQKKELYYMWAAKESYVKLTGRGIGAGIDCYITEHTYQQMQDENGKWLADIKIYETIPDYIVCVCTRENAIAGQLEIVWGMQE